MRNNKMEYRTQISSAIVGGVLASIGGHYVFKYFDSKFEQMNKKIEEVKSSENSKTYMETLLKQMIEEGKKEDAKQFFDLWNSKFPDNQME